MVSSVPLYAGVATTHRGGAIGVAKGVAFTLHRARGRHACWHRVSAPVDMHGQLAGLHHPPTPIGLRGSCEVGAEQAMGGCR